MKDSKTDAARTLKPDNTEVASSRLQKELIQRGRVDIHTHQTVTKHLKQGADALNARDYGKAIEAFQQVIQHNRESAEAHFHLGLAYFMINDYENAIDAYKMAVACEPSEATAHLNLAATYRVLKRYDEAVEVYTRAIVSSQTTQSCIPNLEQSIHFKGSDARQ